MAALGKIFVATVKWMSARQIDTTELEPEQAEERLRACLSCEHLSTKVKVCKKCLCDVTVKTKLLYDPGKSYKAKKNILSKCPVEKW